MNELLGIEPETQHPPVSVVNGKWSLYGTPVMQLPQHERQIVFATILDSVNVDQDRTNSLKF